MHCFDVRRQYLSAVGVAGQQLLSGQTKAFEHKVHIQVSCKVLRSYVEYIFQFLTTKVDEVFRWTMTSAHHDELCLEVTDYPYHTNTCRGSDLRNRSWDVLEGWKRRWYSFQRFRYECWDSSDRNWNASANTTSTWTTFLSIFQSVPSGQFTAFLHTSVVFQDTLGGCCRNEITSWNFFAFNWRRKMMSMKILHSPFERSIWGPVQPSEAKVLCTGMPKSH